MKTLLLMMIFAGLWLSHSFAKDEDIAVTELPKEVSESIIKHHPGAVLLAAEKDMASDGAIQHFEVKIRDSGSVKKLKVLPNGTIEKTKIED